MVIFMGYVSLPEGTGNKYSKIIDSPQQLESLHCMLEIDQISGVLGMIQ